MLDAILGAGLLFPVISWITLGLTWWTYQSTGKSSSALMIPIVGPLLLTGWVLASRHSAWFIPLVWLIDPFTWMCPLIVREFWRISRWTRIATLTGERRNRSVKISLHASGYYVLEQNWKYPHGPHLVTHISEVGQYTMQGDDYELRITEETHRTLRKTADGSFEMIESSDKDSHTADDTLDGWMLEKIDF